MLRKKVFCSLPRSICGSVPELGNRRPLLSKRVGHRGFTTVFGRRRSVRWKRKAALRPPQSPALILGIERIDSHQVRSSPPSEPADRTFPQPVPTRHISTQTAVFTALFLTPAIRPVWP